MNLFVVVDNIYNNVAFAFCIKLFDIVQTVVLIYLCSTSKLPNDLLDMQPTFHPPVHPISTVPQVGGTWGGKNSKLALDSNCCVVALPGVAYPTA